MTCPASRPALAYHKKKMACWPAGKPLNLFSAACRAATLDFPMALVPPQPREAAYLSVERIIREAISRITGAAEAVGDRRSIHDVPEKVAVFSRGIAVYE